MRLTPLSALCLAVAAAACAKSGDKVPDSSAGTVARTDSATAMSAAPAKTIALSDVAGTWHIVSRPADGKDTTSTSVTLNAKADTTGWTMVAGNNKAVPLHVMVSGDSIVESSEPYPSIRRKGLTVHTVGTLRLQNGKLVGTTVAHYKVKSADSVLTLKTEGTKAP
jgi:hypothetical protein